LKPGLTGRSKSRSNAEEDGSRFGFRKETVRLVWIARKDLPSSALGGVFGPGELSPEADDSCIGCAAGGHCIGFGRGAGFNLPYLLACVGPEGKIVALDYSEGMLAAAQRKAQRHGWKNVNFVKADATQMDMEANILDGAICTFGLSAMPGELGALQRVAKAMKPGARFVAFDAKPFTGWGSVMNPISQPLFKYSTNWDYRKDAVASLRSVFSVLEVQEHNSGCNYIAVGRKS